MKESPLCRGSLVPLYTLQSAAWLMRGSAASAMPQSQCSFLRPTTAKRPGDNWLFKTQLSTPRPPWTTVQRVFEKQRRSSKTFMGKGFAWEPAHARIMKEISTIPSIDALEPPSLFRHTMVFLGLSAKDVVLEGKHYIHGCGRYEEDLFVTDQSRRSHTLVLGTNGAGKTRALEAIVAQCIRRGELDAKGKRRYEYEKSNTKKDEVGPDGAEKRLARIKKYSPKHGPVFILDPKGDVDLRDRAFATCKMLGREKKFRYFSPTDANVSFRINPLANFNRATELANRVSALLPSGGDSEAFRQFAWRAINVVVEGLVLINTPINLLTLRQHIEGGIEGLAINCIKKHIRNNIGFYDGWEAEVRAIRQNTRGGAMEPPTPAAEASSLASYYLNKVRVPILAPASRTHRTRPSTESSMSSIMMLSTTPSSLAT